MWMFFTSDDGVSFAVWSFALKGKRPHEQTCTPPSLQKIHHLSDYVLTITDIETRERFFCAGGARPSFEILRSFIDQHRSRFGVEPLCKVLQCAPSAYRRHAARQRNPSIRSDRAKRDEQLSAQVSSVWRANHSVYGADKVWQQMKRERIEVARCTVERLMRRLGIEGVRRGKTQRTTRIDPKQPCPLDRVNCNS